MAILTLTPSRTATKFAQDYYAYAYADRDVRKDGVLITPTALSDTASEDGDISFDLVPSDQADDGKPFTYTVAAFDSIGRRIWIHNIIMPDEDVSIWTLIPETTDLDARGGASIVLVTEAEAEPEPEPEPEPDVYCGVEPVEPAEVLVYGEFATEAEGGRFITRDTDGDYRWTVDAAFDFNVEYDIVLHRTPSLGDSLLDDESSIFYSILRILSSQDTGGSSFTFHDLERAGGQYDDSPYNQSVRWDEENSRYKFLIGHPDDEIELVEGTVLRVLKWTTEGFSYTLDLLDVVQPTYQQSQAEVASYQAAKAEYDQCIADGGIPGYDPSSVFCGVEPVNPGGLVEVTTGLDASRSGTANGGTVVLSEDDTRAVVSGATTSARRILVAASEYDMTEGNWYWEVKFQSYGASNGISAGVVDPENIPPSGIVGFEPFSAGVFGDNASFYNGATASKIGGFSQTSTLRFNFNADTRELNIANDAGGFVLHSTIEPSIVCSAAIHCANSVDVSIALSSDDFTYTIPAGAKALADQVGPSQDDIDAYNTAKAEYDQCIADGGLPGEQQ